MEQNNIFYLLLGICIGGISTFILGQGLLYTCNRILKMASDKLSDSTERLKKSLATLKHAEEKYDEVIREQQNLRGKYKHILEAAEKIALQ